MSTADVLGKFVLCPFYRSTDGKRRIHCEGIRLGEFAAFYFETAAAFEARMQGNCSSAYRDCPIYRGLMLTKYREEGDDRQP